MYVECCRVLAQQTVNKKSLLVRWFVHLKQLKHRIGCGNEGFVAVQEHIFTRTTNRIWSYTLYWLRALAAIHCHPWQLPQNKQSRARARRPTQKINQKITQKTVSLGDLLNAVNVKCKLAVVTGWLTAWVTLSPFIIETISVVFAYAKGETDFHASPP